MKKLMLIVGTIVVIAVGAVFFIQRKGDSKTETETFKFETLSQGDLSNIVSSTGTLSAVGTVEVGSQISGVLDKVLVDYNDKVKKGQLLAVVDATMLEATVVDAQANVAKSQAQLDQAKTQYQRNEKLFQEKYVSEMDFLTAETNVATAQAALESAKAALKRAEVNLRYAKIRSPIDGTVIQRSVDAGQTIAASQSAPTLFIIAKDMANMQIEASVDESDIGQIKDGMAVRFTVQAYPDETFTGKVRQIRLQPKTVQDVVNYTVVVDAANVKGLLLPGMTATVDFLVEERQDVLLVPNTALNFKPSETLMAQLRQQLQEQTANRQGDGTGMTPQPAEGQRQARPQGQDRSGNNSGTMRPMGTESSDQNGDNGRAKMSRVFYLDDAGSPKMARLVTGATDGKMTEVVKSGQLQEGTRVITGLNGAQQTTNQKSALHLPIPGMGGPPPR